MSHLHFPDGILSPWLWISGWLLTAGLFSVTARVLKRESELRKFPLAGAFAAVMFLGMSFEIVPIAYHVNLSVMAGAVLGPAMSLFVAVLVNVALAAFGHGGITVAGLNALILAFEMIVGWAAVRLFIKAAHHVFVAGATAVMLTLALSTMLAVNVVMLGVPYLSGIKFFDAVRFAEISLGLGSVGWLLEAWLTGAVLSSFSRLKPELISTNGSESS